MSALSELQNYTFVSKYARHREEDKRRETWDEAVDRVRDMMYTKYADKGDVVKQYITDAYEAMRKKHILGSQRALQYGGKPALIKNARVYNCLSSYCDRLRFFQECFWLLLCGGGTGFSVQKHHVAKLPSFQINIHSDVKIHYVEDTIEGWANAVGILLTNYFGVQTGMEEFREYANCGKVFFDYSFIRPEGSKLSSGVGKAPGPDGLKEAIEKIRALLDRCKMSGQDKLRPIDAYDIVMHISDAVLSGGVRRSASLAIFSVDDEEMASAKTGNWLQENPQRARSNNSALLIRNKTTKKEFERLISLTKEFGEPGYIWSDSPEMLNNPCVEISFFAYLIQNEAQFQRWIDENGPYAPITCHPEEIGLLSGWQGCNLTTQNCRGIRSAADFFERAKQAAVIGTLQAGFTDLDYLGWVSEEIFKKEALLGVSMTGMMEAPEVVLKPENLRQAAKVVLDTNAEIAGLIGINPTARGTCLKPEGTTSLHLGVQSGFSAAHGEMWIRNVQGKYNENPLIHFAAKNPRAVKKSVWSQDGKDVIASFPMKAKAKAKLKKDFSAIDSLEIVKSIQQNWVLPGTRKALCIMPWLNHNVSNTITVKDEEWEEVTDYIYDNREYLCGISLLGHTGDKDYPQAPFQEVLDQEKIVEKYGRPAVWTSGLIELALEAYDQDLWAACRDIMNDKVSVGFDISGPFESEVLMLEAYKRVRFWNKARRFAKKYYGGDIKKLTYCMKDVYLLKEYTDIAANMKRVDYTTMIEEDDNTNPHREAACAGGACQV